MQIGFIGLGNMGAPMAANLVGAGHTLAGYDVAGVKVDGVKAVSSASEAASGADVIITMLPNGAILLDVYKSIIGSVSAGTVLVDCSTVDVASAREAHALAAGAGALSLDAPVSGGVGGAAAGTLTFMVGGSDEAFARIEPLFDVMGSKAVHCGTGGTGQSAKICNNMLLGISMIGACEAFALAEKLDLDPGKLFDVVSTSSGYCWSVNAYCPVPGVGPQSPADNDYKPGFAAELMLKDLLLSQTAADATGAATPLGEAASALYATFVDNGGRGRDFSGMLPHLKTLKREN